jgi:Aldo/keto reductase family
MTAPHPARGQIGNRTGTTGAPAPPRPQCQADHDDAIRIIHKSLDAGINFVDIADAYSLGESEEIVDAEEPPLRVLFGVPVTEIARGIYERRLKEWTAWEDLAARTYGR